MNGLKQTYLLFFTAFIMIIGCLLFADAPWLHTEGNQLKDPDGNTVILRGVSMIDIGAEESWYGGIYNNIDRLVNKNDSRGSSPGWYTKIIRIPVNFDPTAADTNCNGNIDIVDALLIAQYYVDLITGFC